MIPLGIKVGLFGAQGTGKTTAMNATEEALREMGYDVGIVTETARRCPHSINKASNGVSQRWIQAEQLYVEAQMVKGHDIVLTDRTSFDHLAYAIDCLVTGRMEEGEYTDYRKVALAWLNTYDVLCYFPIEFALVPDGVRDIDPTWQAKIDENIRGLIEDTGVVVQYIRGSVVDRVHQIIGAIDNLFTEAEKELMEADR
jgi:GTPase SAR1 family protein